MSKTPRPKINVSEMPLVAHLIEMRNRLLKVVVFVLLVFLATVPFANDLYTFLAKPLMAHLPQGATMIATEVASPFFTPFKLTMVLSIFASMPFILYQVWAFIAPGLYQHERRMVVPLLASSTGLFYLGGVFAYYVVFPIVFGFFTSAAPDGVSVMTDIAKYLDFVLKMFFAFGLAFEVPIAIIVLVWVGVVTPQGLAEKRAYFIVAAFVVGMLLTPPDVISQSLLALPMILLFELGLFFSKAFVRKPEDEEVEEVATSTSVANDEPLVDGYEEQHAVGDTDATGIADEPVSHESEWRDLTDEEFEAEFDRAEREEQGLFDHDSDAATDKPVKKDS